MKIIQSDSMEGHRTLSRSNHNDLLGGKDVSLVVTVSVITEERKRRRCNGMLTEPNKINVLLNFHGIA